MEDVPADEFDLSALILHNNAISPFFGSPSTSATPAPEPVPRSAPKGISKRRGKKRSSRACTTCRQRKVRCNIVAHGAPCSNCRHDEIVCILPLSRRQRSARDRAEKNLRESMDGSEAGELRSLNTELLEAQNHTHPGIERAHSVSSLAPHGMRMSEHPLAEILPAVAASPKPQETAPAPSTSIRTRSWIQIQSPLASSPVPATHAMKAPDQRIPVLPKIFAPFPKSLDSADLMYLHTRDALTLPSETLQIALLKSYVDHVHWNMPILDLEDFLCTVKYGCEGSSTGKSSDDQNQITFLLFQAVMFAGVEYVGMKALREAGWHKREEARRALFGRVKILYDFDTTADRLSITQSLLLITLYNPVLPPLQPLNRTSSTKDASHYLNLAISLSYSLGLHRTLPLPTPRCPSFLIIRKRRLERRIFWTAFIRDRLLATSTKDGFKRPVQIKKEDCEISLLTLLDFDMSPESGDDDSEETIRDRVSAKNYMEKVLLCWNGSDCAFGSAVLGTQQPTKSVAQHQWQEQVIEEPVKKSVWQSHTENAQRERNIFTTTACSFPFTSLTNNLGPSESDPSPSTEMDTEMENAYAYHAPSSATSSESPLLTPRGLDEDPLSFKAASPVATSISSASGGGELGAGIGVDGEYDDYLEFLGADVGVETVSVVEVKMSKGLELNRGIRERGMGGKRRNGMRRGWGFRFREEDLDV